MGFRPGEVLHGGAVALLRHEPQIRLNAAPEQDAGLGLTLTKNPIDELVDREGRHHMRIGSGGENVDVSGRVRAAANAADRHERDGRAFRAEIVE